LSDDAARDSAIDCIEDRPNRADARRDRRQDEHDLHEGQGQREHHADHEQRRNGEGHDTHDEENDVEKVADHVLDQLARAHSSIAPSVGLGAELPFTYSYTKFRGYFRKLKEPLFRGSRTALRRGLLRSRDVDRPDGDRQVPALPPEIPVERLHLVHCVVSDHAPVQGVGEPHEPHELLALRLLVRETAGGLANGLQHVAGIRAGLDRPLVVGEPGPRAALDAHVAEVLVERVDDDGGGDVTEDRGDQVIVVVTHISSIAP